MRNSNEQIDMACHLTIPVDIQRLLRACLPPDALLLILYGGITLILILSRAL
jgi:hypothetical protein